MNAHSKLLEETEIWKFYTTGLPTNNPRSTWVRQIYDTAIIYLKDVRLRFQNYTLHDETHVLNVLDAMAGILGDQISQLSKGETEILILAACMHDLGMVYTDEEVKQCFADKKRTREFLRINDPERLGCPATEWPEHIRQDYLRWLHPFRLPEVFQNEEWRTLLSAWPTETIPKRCVLAVCQAHGETPEEFSKDRNMEYLAASDADPLFCALLLRLADLLDFDDTRAPKVLYSYIVFNEKSRKEWEKHLASGGFCYPNSPSVAKLPYKAYCTNPGIEHTIRDFLDWIDSELSTCVRLQQNCHQDWQRSFPFPQSIAREEIESDGYVSGDFLMTMDQARIMELLTGEELYNKNDIFIRELLQNSIDATLLRLEMDRDFPQEDARIDLWEWNDKDGSIWFRIDDQGTGMTLGMLQRYFLKVGNSYYTSQELKRDLRDHGKMEDYQSISHFGIGFLSCFLCGTFAEVSTLYFDPRKNMEENGSVLTRRVPDYGLRLQVTGLEGYYALKSQAEQHVTDTPMPKPEDYAYKAVPDLEQGGYRAKPGTSISVKLDPGRLGATNLCETVKEYLCCAKVPVYYNGERIGRTYVEAMDAIHELENETIYELTSELKKKFDECFPNCAGQYPKVSVTIMPLDAEKNQVSSNLSGAFIKYDVKFEKCPSWQIKGRNYKISAKIQVESSRLLLHTQNADYDNGYLDWDNFITGHSRQEVRSLTAALEALPIPPDSEGELGEAWHLFERERISPEAVWQIWMDNLQNKVLEISFKELGLPAIDSLTGGRNRSVLTCSYRGVIAGNVQSLFGSTVQPRCTVLLLLDNQLRPTVKASRSEVFNMPLELIVAICGMMSAWGSDCGQLFQVSGWSVPSLPSWRKLCSTKLKIWLWDNLRDLFKGMKEKFGKPIFAGDEKGFCIRVFWTDAEDVLRAFLMASLQDSYQMKVNYEAGQVITFTNKPPDEDGGQYDLFPPMMFCTAATQASQRFLCSGDANFRRCINVDHPYAMWLIKNAAALNVYYNRQFKQIIDVFLHVDSENIIEMCNGIRDQLLSFPDRHSIDMTACPQLSEADFWAPTEAPENI